MYALKLYSVVFQKGDVYTNFTMPIFCVSLNSITSPSFTCWSIPVSEIREFNRKEKKMNNSYFQFNAFPMVEMVLANVNF